MEGCSRYALSVNSEKKREAVFVAHCLCKKINMISLITKSMYLKVYMGCKEIHQIIESDYF